LRRNKRIALRVIGVPKASIVLAEWSTTEGVNTAVGVVARLLVNVASTRRQFIFLAVILVTTYSNENYDIICI
jgi:hypothetical protein